MGRWNTIYITTSSGCWIWQGAKYMSGYGIYKKQYAHRYFYEMKLGIKIEAGKQIHHICSNKLCVNPSHLIQLSNSDHQKLHGKLRTHCNKGHEYTPENTRWRPNSGERVCKACHRIYNRLHK